MDWEVLTVECNGENSDRIFPRLLSFWKEYLLPEIVELRLFRNLELREPILLEHIWKRWAKIAVIGRF